MRISRAAFLRTAILAAPAWMLDRRTDAFTQGGGQGDAQAGGQNSADERRARVAAFISAYDAQGVHRTASDVDNRSASWLAEEATRAGGAARLEPFSLNRIDVAAAVLRANGPIIDGLPFFDGGFTDAAGITGRLGPPSALTEIALVRLDQAAIATEGQSIAEVRRSTAHRAIVAVTEGGTPGLSPSNAAAFRSPYGVPVLQVGSEHLAMLATLSQAQSPVTLVAFAERTPATAQNVVVTVAGRQPSLSPVVVMTPRSGWWHCASERGGGLACWLEIVRAVANASPARPVMFVASSGHELGHDGLEAFIKARPGLIAGAAAWVHLGANIGAKGGGARLQAADDEVERVMLAALDTAGAAIRQRVPRGTVPAGEARNIHTGGGRYVSLLGSGPLFHNVKDRWPDAVDLDAVTRFAAALSNLTVSLAQQP